MSTRRDRWRGRAATGAAVAAVAALAGGCSSDAPSSAVSTAPPTATGLASTTLAVPSASSAAPLTSTVAVTLPPPTLGPEPTQPAATLPPTTVPATTAPAPGTTATNVEVTVATVATPVGTPAPTAAPTPTTTIVIGGLTLAPCIDEPQFQVDQRPPRGEVALYQFTLDRLGYDPGDIDGYFGPNTMSAGADEILDHSPGSGRELFLDEGVIAAPAFRRLGIACRGG